MDFPYEHESETERESFINSWYQQEKTSERIGAILLLFASAVILVTERLSVASVEYKTLALALAVGFFAGGITLLLRSRRPREERRALNFLKLDSHIRNANMVGFMAAFLFSQANGQTVILISAGMMIIFALWLHWRAFKIRQFDALFNKSNETKAGDE